MGRDPLESIISIHDLKQAEWFTTDEAGITNLKRKTRKNAREFLYLRKGEDFGAFIQMLYELYSQQPEQIQITYDLYFNQFATILECISIKRILEYDWEQILAFYLALTNSKELLIKSGKVMQKILKNATDLLPIKHYKIICNQDKVNEKAIIGWESLKCQVKNYKDPESAGNQRFYVSDKELYIFIRKSDKNFFGFHSTDVNAIKELVKQFNEEWKINS